MSTSLAKTEQLGLNLLTDPLYAFLENLNYGATNNNINVKTIVIDIPYKLDRQTELVSIC